MQRQGRQFWWRHSGWLASGVFHATLLMGFALMVMPLTEGSSAIAIDSRFSSPDAGEVAFESAPAFQPESGEESVGGGEITSGGIDVASLANAAGNVEARAVESGMGLGRSRGVLASSWGDGLQGMGSGFFGLSATGTKFVYVVDASGSMQGHRFSRARKELIRSLKRLRPRQEFYVIFYNHQTYPMPGEGLTTASSTNLKTALDWIGDVKTLGGTFPERALTMALELKPDAIYFLTDGAFDPSVVENVRAVNAGQVTIHTICFEDQSGQQILQSLAAQNRGRFRYVP